MTPAINLAKKLKIPFTVHEYQHDAAAASYGEEAAEKMGVSSDRVFKTLVVSVDGANLHVAIVPVSHQLSLKKVAKAAGLKKVSMADKQRVEKTTGYVLGGVSPLGQKRLLPTVLDETAMAFDTIFVSAGKRGLEIELTPHDLLNALKAISADIRDN